MLLFNISVNRNSLLICGGQLKLTAEYFAVHKILAQQIIEVSFEVSASQILKLRSAPFGLKEPEIYPWANYSILPKPKYAHRWASLLKKVTITSLFR
jgi:hypothetical protein